MLARAFMGGLLLLLGLAAGLGVSEAMLAAAGVPLGGSTASGWATDDMAARYTLTPGFYPGLFGADASINIWGMRGPRVDHADVLLLGDSCTFGVGIDEPLTFAGRLRKRGYAVANAAVPGYNSTSGLAHLKAARLLSFAPKAVVIYFGWNDHRLAAAPESLFAALRLWAPRLRTAALLLRFQESLVQGKSIFGRLRLVPQVPLGEFKSNLREMIGLARAAGARPIVVTAASYPAFPAEDQPIFDDYRAYHARYVEAAREVARETGATLFDFEAEMARVPMDRRGPYFHDFVHFSARGHKRFADELAGVLAGLDIKPSKRYSKPSSRSH